MLQHMCAGSIAVHVNYALKVTGALEICRSGCLESNKLILVVTKTRLRSDFSPCSQFCILERMPFFYSCIDAQWLLILPT